jgi:hypothetical protein
MSGFRYSTPLIIPDASDVKDRLTNQEITYIMNALRTLATRLDEVSGALSPVPADWPTVSPITSILGNNINKFYASCAENIPYGAFVNFYNLNPTDVQARCARAASFDYAAGGYCVTPGGFTTGQWGEFVVGPGVNYGIGGMTPGNWYFLDPATTTGQVTAAQPVTPGQILQLCGQAITDNMLLVGSLNNWLVI